MTFRIAVAADLHPPGRGPDKHFSDAVRAIEHAAHEGADFVCFPGAIRVRGACRLTFDPVPPWPRPPRQGVHAVFGTIEPSTETPPPTTSSSYRIRMAARRRATGARIRTAPDLYRSACLGISIRRRQRISRCSIPCMAGSDHGRACRKSRGRPLAARRRACFHEKPAGTDGAGCGENWRTLIWARAIENLAVVATTQNLSHTGSAARQAALARRNSTREHRGGRERRRRRSGTGALPVGDATRPAPRPSARPSRACSGPQWQRPELYDLFYLAAARNAALSRRTHCLAAVPPRP